MERGKMERVKTEIECCWLWLLSLHWGGGVEVGVASLSLRRQHNRWAYLHTTYEAFLLIADCSARLSLSVPSL